MRSGFRLVQADSEVPELAVARSGLRETTPQVMVDRALRTNDEKPANGYRVFYDLQKLTTKL